MDLTLQRTLDICRASETASQIKVLVSSERTEVHLIKNKYQGIQSEFFTKENIAFFLIRKTNTTKLGELYYICNLKETTFSLNLNVDSS